MCIKDDANSKRERAARSLHGSGTGRVVGAAGQLIDVRLELLHLLAQVGELERLRVDVDDGFILYLARPIGVAQRVQRLLHVRVGRADARDHERVRVAAERVLEEARELALAIGLVALLVARVVLAEHADDVANDDVN